MPVSAVRTTAPSIYGRVFWLSYAANIALVTANALTFRFAELIHVRGGSERIAGAIVGTGMLGALAARLFLGQAIDHYGVKRLWIGSSVLVVAGVTGFLVADGLGWPIYAARISFSVGLAGVFTCSMVHIQNQVPPERRTEVIASLGSSGFVGMMIGSVLGDVILELFADDPNRFWVLFGTSGLLGATYLVIVSIVTWGDQHDRPVSTPHLHELLFVHWPGLVLVVAMLMGVMFTVISVFLTRYATHLGIGGIGPFFVGYALSAFSFRVLSRSWSRVIGRHRLILLGLAGHTLGAGSFLLVGEAWHLVVPSVCMGFGHALLFPAVVSLGAGAFPPEYRGSGTTVVLGFVESGTMLGAPILGAVIDNVGFQAMFLTAGGLSLATGLLYVAKAAWAEDEDMAFVPPAEVIECPCCAALVPNTAAAPEHCPVCATALDLGTPLPRTTPAAAAGRG